MHDQGSSKKSESSQPQGFGRPESSQQGPRPTRTIGEQSRGQDGGGRQDARPTTTDVTQMASNAVESASSVVEKTIVEQMNNRPLRTLGLAAGVGYLLGRGGPSFRMTGMLFGTATRVAAGLAVLKEVGEVGQDLQSSLSRLQTPGNGFDLLKEIGQFGRQIQSSVARFTGPENHARP